MFTRILAVRPARRRHPHRPPRRARASPSSTPSRTPSATCSCCRTARSPTSRPSTPDETAELWATVTDAVVAVKHAYAAGGRQRRRQPRPAGRRQRQRAPPRPRRAAVDRRLQLHDGHGQHAHPPRGAARQRRQAARGLADVGGCPPRPAGTVARVPRAMVLAPAPVVTVTVERDADGADEVHVHAGGQGFWIAQLLAELGLDVVLVRHVSAVRSASLVHALVDAHRVELHPVEVSAANGAYVHDRRSGERVEVAEMPAGVLSRHEVDDLYGAALVEGLHADVCVLGGGPVDPPVVPADLYRRLAGDLVGRGQAGRRRPLRRGDGGRPRGRRDGGQDRPRRGGRRRVGDVRRRGRSRRAASTDRRCRRPAWSS